MEQNLLQRINELAKKKKTVGLTAEEQAEQKKLYKIYLGEIRQQFSATLDNVSVEEKDGTVVPFKEAYKKKG
ncbi:DUF896 domain-containing protein [Lachnoclostridium sp. MSJ-17]|uniref:DUF896 domain-containing protein n=1 Tax=Lachnoclostridium sp. MSJ-17 TaxID=2841516 RepID=UPI001C10BE23|nr:DUF896 domain-containing protein [Lachnoclostridium sp. MSJ-17]MBU5461326.1 DUF896 domain-containing protein [Lachnoclostridium sp. MSJ-17]